MISFFPDASSARAPHLASSEECSRQTRFGRDEVVQPAEEQSTTPAGFRCGAVARLVVFPVPQGLHRGKLQAKMTESTQEFNELMRAQTSQELGDLTPPREGRRCALTAFRGRFWD